MNAPPDSFPAEAIMPQSSIIRVMPRPAITEKPIPSVGFCHDENNPDTIADIISAIKLKIPIFPVGSSVDMDIHARIMVRISIVTIENPRHIIKQRPTLDPDFFDIRKPPKKLY
jgi:hypothetical protein